MAIHGAFALWPYGNSTKAQNLVHFHIYTRADGQAHNYGVIDNKGRVLVRGSVPKTKSGHRNILHLLRTILNNPMLDALEENYVATIYDKPMNIEEKTEPQTPET